MCVSQEQASDFSSLYVVPSSACDNCVTAIEFVCVCVHPPIGTCFLLTLYVCMHVCRYCIYGFMHVCVAAIIRKYWMYVCMSE